jgi:hypothetical protein
MRLDHIEAVEKVNVNGAVSFEAVADLAELNKLFAIDGYAMSQRD